ncbi:MAG TPA: hypothetical protein VIP78_07065, partial [Candidatus Dormibacteraeota bacterium]
IWLSRRYSTDAATRREHPAQPTALPTLASTEKTLAGTQIHAHHEGAFLLQQQGGVWTRRLGSPASTMNTTPDHGLQPARHEAA